MKTPNFLKGAVKTARARKTMEVGTKFLNAKIDPDLTAKDLLGCLAIAAEDQRPAWFMIRLHGVYNRRRTIEEKNQLFSY